MNDSDLCQKCGHKRSEHTLFRVAGGTDSARPVGTHRLECPTGLKVWADEFDSPATNAGPLTAALHGIAPQPAGGHPEFLALLDQMRELHCRKAADYGTRGDDPLANLRASEAFGIPAWVGAVMRCNDKMRRVMSFVKNGELKNESVEDSLLDGAAYFLLALVLFRESKKGGAS